MVNMIAKSSVMVNSESATLSSCGVNHTHTITSDVRIFTSYIQREGRFPGEGEGGV